MEPTKEVMCPTCNVTPNTEGVCSTCGNKVEAPAAPAESTEPTA